MSTKNYLKHTVTNTPPTFSDVGDEYFAPANNTLFKKVVYNGTNVAWTQIVSTGTDGNIALSGNSISFLANNKYPIYFGSTTRTTTGFAGFPSSSNTFVGINTSGYFNSFSSGTNALSGTPYENISIFLQPKGAGGILTSIPDPNYNGANFSNIFPGNFRGAYSVDLQLYRSQGSAVASGSYSALIGGASNMVSGSYSAVLGGASNQVSGNYAAAIGGNTNYVNSDNGVIIGGNYATTRGMTFYNVLTNNAILFGSASGGSSTSQGGIMTLGGATTPAAPTRTLFSNGNTVFNNLTGGINALQLPSNCLFGFKGTLVAAVTGGPGAGNAMWTFEGSIAKGSTTVSTALVGIPTISLLSADSIATSNNWYFSITADNTTNSFLSINVRGDTNNTIRWYCKLETSEVTY